MVCLYYYKKNEALIVIVIDSAIVLPPSSRSAWSIKRAPGQDNQGYKDSLSQKPKQKQLQKLKQQ